MGQSGKISPPSGAKWDCPFNPSSPLRQPTPQQEAQTAAERGNDADVPMPPALTPEELAEIARQQQEMENNPPPPPPSDDDDLLD